MKKLMSVLNGGLACLNRNSAFRRHRKGRFGSPYAGLRSKFCTRSWTLPTRAYPEEVLSKAEVHHGGPPPGKSRFHCRRQARSWRRNVPHRQRLERSRVYFGGAAEAGDCKSELKALIS